jgi:hypothetical protein
MSRGLNPKILQIEVQELIAHQPVATIDRGELVPLPQDFVSKHPEIRYVSTAIEQQPQKIDNTSRYNPTARDLRQMYSTLRSCGDTIGLSEVKKLGVKLNDLYPSGDRAVGDFSHPDVSIDRKFMENRQQARASMSTTPSSNNITEEAIPVQYHPTAYELRKAYSIKQAAGDRTALAKIIELGTALNAAYPNGDRAAGDFSHPDVSIDLDEKAGLLDYPIAKTTVTITPKTEIELDFD